MDILHVQGTGLQGAIVREDVIRSETAKAVALRVWSWHL